MNVRRARDIIASLGTLNDIDFAERYARLLLEAVRTLKETQRVELIRQLEEEPSTPSSNP